MEAIFFADPADLRAWFAQHHATTPELFVGFHKRATGKPSVTWPEAVDEALCVGWIDGVRRGLDEQSYVIRFTPRRRGSIWSAVNLRRVEALTAEGRMRAEGLAAFEQRTGAKSKIYAYEQKEEVELPEEFAHRFRENAAAWAWFQTQAAWYRRTAVWRVVSAKQTATRWKRLESLILASGQERRW